MISASCDWYFTERISIWFDWAISDPFCSKLFQWEAPINRTSTFGSFASLIVESNSLIPELLQLRQNTNIIIEIEGGMVGAVYTDAEPWTEFTVQILDWDMPEHELSAGFNKRLQNLIEEYHEIY